MIFIVMLTFVLFNNSLVGHVRGSICLSISGTRAVVIKIQLDLIWGTMATRGGKYVYNGLGSSVFRYESGKPHSYR